MGSASRIQYVTLSSSTGGKKYRHCRRKALRGEEREPPSHQECVEALLVRPMAQAAAERWKTGSQNHGQVEIGRRANDTLFQTARRLADHR